MTFPLTGRKGVYKTTDFQNQTDTQSRIPKSAPPRIIRRVANLPTLGDHPTFIDLPTFVHVSTLVNLPTFHDLP